MKIRFSALILLFALGGVVATWADPPPPVVVNITPQVLERDQSVTWQQPLTKVTRAGVPVVVNIDAESLAIRVSVTPFVRGADFLLVVQGDVKQTGHGGTRGSSSLQSLMVTPGVPIAFFPLGREPGDSGRQMVVLIRVDSQRE